MEPIKVAAADRRPVVLAFRNDIQRLGVERLLHGLDVPTPDSGQRDLASAAAMLGGGPSAPVLLGELRDVDEPTGQVLRAAAGRGLRMLLLVDVEHVRPTRTLGVLAEQPGIGFVETQHLDARAVLHGLDAAATEEMPIPPRLARQLLASTRHDDDTGAAPQRPRLTPREQEALALLVEGLSNRQIARRLRISEHGAKRHVANILGKLNCSNRTLAVSTALRTGLYPAPEDGDRTPVGSGTG